MTERTAHLVDAVLPWVPVRQWVLTVPYRLRYQMAWNHGLTRAALLKLAILAQQNSTARGTIPGRCRRVLMLPISELAPRLIGRDFLLNPS